MNEFKQWYYKPQPKEETRGGKGHQMSKYVLLERLIACERKNALLVAENQHLRKKLTELKEKHAL